MGFDDGFQRLQMRFKRFFSFIGHEVGCVGFLPDEGFFRADEFILFQRFDVAGQVSIRHIQEVFQGGEIEPVVHRQGRHDAEPDAAFERLMKIVESCFHRSYRICMVIPYRMWAAPNPMDQTNNPCSTLNAPKSPSAICTAPRSFTSQTVY